MKVADAFRFPQRGSHIEKLVLTMHRDIPLPLTGPVSPRRVACSSHASYLLVGGLGGLGRAVSAWMVKNGAQHLTYLSHSCEATSADHSFLPVLQELDCAVECVRGSVVNMEGVRE